MLDQVETLEALAACGIQVARTKYVDSAEDAIAFASRREARDPRLVPILLRVDIPGAYPIGPLRNDRAIRRAFEKLSAGGSQTRILAQVATELGTELVIEGHAEEGAGKVIELRGQSHGITRMLPLDEAGARALVEHYRGFGHHGKSEREQRMLEHLLLRAAAFYEQEEVSAFRLDPVRLHGGTYTVLGASVILSAPIHLVPRADHDRKAEGYHPAGKQ